VEQRPGKPNRQCTAAILLANCFMKHTSFSSPMSFSLIDDRDPKITYTGTWNLGGSPNEHNSTVSSSIKVGNHFSVPFTGAYMFQPFGLSPLNRIFTFRDGHWRLWDFRFEFCWGRNLV
jgi:hypothetical protein